jgi:hypothetical protein
LGCWSSMTGRRQADKHRLSSTRLLAMKEERERQRELVVWTSGSYLTGS